MTETKILHATPLQTNNYLLFFENGAVLVEASASVEAIREALGGKKLCAVLLTHSHFDHAQNLENILKEFGAKCYLNKKCFEKIRMHKKEFYGDRSFCVDGCDDKVEFVEEGDEIEVCGEKILCVETFGHTDDSMSFVVDDKVFVGDLIFRDGVGRTDLPTGNEEDEERSIEKILSLPRSCEIFPGHGQKTSVGEQLKIWGI